jgi:colanic acid biosynthesis protein WcaH
MRLLYDTVVLDLLIFNDSGKVLLGLRQNRPAKGYWFVPGGRVFKNETLSHAFTRILANETGLSEIDIKNVCFHGIYEHFHEDNFL